MAVDTNKLSFYSGTRYERVNIKSSVTFSVAGGGFATTTVTVPHNLGYKPYYRAWYTFSSGKYFQLFSGNGSFDLDGNSAQIDTVSVTTTSLVVLIDNFGAPAITGRLYYRIYEEAQV